MLDELPFSEVWAVDFEFRPEDGREGSRPDPVCLVAYELKGGRRLRLWRDEFGPRHIASGRTQSSLPTMPVPKSAAISP